MSESVKRALVTGTSTGISEATVRRLRGPGWDIVTVAHREECLAALAAETGCEYAAADLGDETAVGTLAARVLEGGPVDALVSNAGGTLGVDTIAHADPGRWIAMYHHNVMTALRTTRAFLSKMREKGGDLVFLTSTAAHNTYPGDGGYVAARHTEHVITNTLHQEPIEEPVRIIEIAPGTVKTPGFLLSRLGSEETVTRVYEDVAGPLFTDSVADAICWALTRPAHVNIDLMVPQPVVQAANTLLARQG